MIRSKFKLLEIIQQVHDLHFYPHHSVYIVYQNLYPVLSFLVIGKVSDMICQIKCFSFDGRCNLMQI